MKKYIVLFLPLALLAAACSNKEQDKGETEVAATAGTGEKDPVCNMERDSTWTEFTVANGDTTWFCSPHCKEAFAKRTENAGNPDAPVTQ